MNPLQLVLLALPIFAAACIASLSLHRRPRASSLATGILCAVASAIAFSGAVWELIEGRVYEVSALLLPASFPRTVLHLDQLSAVFIAVISAVAFYTSLFSVGYAREYFDKPLRLSLMGVCYSSFVASMIMVALAGDAILFIVFWEVMSVTSFFLVMMDYERSEVRRAAMLYLIYATVSAVFVFAGFGIGYACTKSFVFSDWRTASLPPSMAALMFALFFVGFSAKAGLVPLHSWLPQAHPAAPSHVSALLSGVMVKVAVYGLVRMLLYVLAPHLSIAWGSVIMGFAALTTFYGIAYALIQRDLKRLLAYSTIENVGIIYLGLGLAVSAYAAHTYPLYIAALTASLFHVANHAVSKSLLFLCSGAVLQSTGTRDLLEMGGLLKRLRLTAVAFLLGSLGIAAMPFFNCFASEWILYNSLLLSMGSPSLGIVTRVLSAASFLTLATAGVLATYCFSKAFGLAFLTEPRSPEAERAKPEPLSIRMSYAVPMISVVAIGLAPALVAQPIASIVARIPGPPLAAPMLGLRVALWSSPSMYIPAVLACFASVAGFIAWSSSIARTTTLRTTTPFVSGADFEKSFVPTPSLYVGNGEELMRGLYGVRRAYERDYAVRLWTTRRIVIERLPVDPWIRVLRRIGLSDEDIKRIVHTHDDFLQALVTVGGRALVFALSRHVERSCEAIYEGFRSIAVAFLRVGRSIASMDKGIYLGFRGIASAFSALSRAVRRIQCGNLYAYLAYVYVVLILALIYFALTR